MGSSTNSHGVGPHPKPWPNDERFDPELLSNGDSRNVVDKYRYWTNDAIVKNLDTQRSSLEIAIENLDHDFNMGTIVRTANAFNARKVYIIGRKQWNKRGAMVTNRYLDVEHFAELDDFLEATKDKELIAIDNQPGAQSLHEFKFPREAILIFGSEANGISSELMSHCSNMVEIEQFGSTRSINVGVAAGIVMYAYVQQHVIK
ncbi:MAG: TrmH family RNA methyltransferase [Candidatus Nanosyncoccaceae bacterium]|jgi:tRNA G18 (ribose-2'-O)-methylase SpoU